MTNAGVMLTVGEWEVVQSQCRPCVHWNDKDGCSFPGASDNKPCTGCGVRARPKEIRWEHDQTVHVVHDPQTGETKEMRSDVTVPHQTVAELLETARRTGVYDVETFLEDEGIALFRTYMKGDERLTGERVDHSIIRQVLEEK